MIHYRPKGRIGKLLKGAIQRCIDNGELKLADVPRLEITYSRQAEHGDFSSNAAFLIARAVKISPREAAAKIVDKLTPLPENLEKVEVAGQGFINFFVQPTFWHNEIKTACSQREHYGRIPKPTGKKVMVEFVSANPTGPLHIGHGRGAAIGDALASLLEAAGNQVTREYYINDAGTQMETLGRSVLIRMRQLLGEKVDLPEDHYRGRYVFDIARQILNEEGPSILEKQEKESVAVLAEKAGKIILDTIKQDLMDFRVHYDSWFSEKSLFDRGEVDRIIKDLKERNLAYEKDGALWFRSSHFGDEKDRVLIKADGEKTYFASDIAYHKNKFERGFDKVVNIWGADHHGYIPRMLAAVEALGRKRDDLKIILVKLVNLLRSGRDVPMSTRAGEFVTLREVMNEVGVDPMRFIFLTRHSNSTLDFDLDIAKSQKEENRCYYVQYAYVRIKGFFRHCQQAGIPVPESWEEVDLSPLTLPEEVTLMKRVASYPEMLEEAASALEPHRIAAYLDDLATALHKYYYRGTRENSARVVSSDPKVTAARLCLAEAVGIVIKNGLGILGVSTPEEM